MAIISMSNASSIKVKFDQGFDVNDNRIVKTKTYSSVKADASSEDIITIVNALTSLQQHTLVGINRIDNTSLAE